MTTITPEKAAAAILHWRNDPAWFFEHTLERPLFLKQQEMVRSVAHHRRTSILGANSSGKDYTSGGIILWWLQCWEAAKVIVTGPTFRQVSDIIWREARQAYRDAPVSLGGTMYEREPRYEINDSRYALGFSTDRSWNVQGFHSPHLLVIVTEAHGMDQEDIDALKRLNPERLLLTGNPLALGGEFYDSFHANRELYNTIRIAAIDTPNIDTIDPETGFATGTTVTPGMLTAEDVTERAREYGVGSPMYVASVLAQFPTNLEDAIVSLEQAEAAVARYIQPVGDDAILGVDVARYGTDKTVFYLRRGEVARKVYEAQGRSLMAIVGRIMELLKGDLHIRTVVVDDTGIGGGVTDRLRELEPPGVKIVPFIGGSRARSHRFFNRVAECWWRMRQAFIDGHIDIEEDKALISQITTRRYQLRSDRVIQLEPKEEMKKRLGGSPDHADALMQTYAVEGGRSSEARGRVRAGITLRHPLGLDADDERYRDTDTGHMPGGY